MDNLIFLFLIGVIVLFMLFPWRNLGGNLIFTPFLQGAVTFVVSIYTILSFLNFGYISQQTSYFLLFHFFIFYIAWSCVIIFSRKTIKFGIQRVRLQNIAQSDNLAFPIVFLSYILISLFYQFMLWNNFSSGDERLILNRQWRALSIIMPVLGMYVFSYLSLSFLKGRKRNKSLIMLFLFFGLNLSAGSKGALLQYYIMFMMLTIIIKGNERGKILRRSLFLMFFLFFPTWLMYGEGFIQKIIHRIRMSGDVYSFSFISGNYRLLLDYYDPTSYFLHPLTAIFGFRGYDFPFGAVLMSTAGLEISGMGPNSHLPMLNLLFFDGSLFESLPWLALFILLSCLYLYFGIYALARLNFSLTANISIMLLSYSNFMTVLFDPGVFAFSLIYTMLTVSIYLFFRFVYQFFFQKQTHHQRGLS
jgi:hypothetical protein